MSRRRSTDTPQQAESPSSAEWVLLASIVLAGVALRCAFPSRMAVEHFDEGVYASNLWFPEAGYPARYLYAPPLFPWLVEWAMVFFGTGHWGTMLVNISFGSLTIPLVWWVTRRWFGPGAGLSAAMLAATSDFHLLYSRTVLTDVSLCFWLLLAVYCFGEAFRRGGYRWAIAAGISTGLAWSTKYNGWLPLAIGIAGLAGWAVFERPGRQAVWRNFLLWGTAAVTAVVVWMPAWNSLPNGYAEVAANHRQYLVGFDQWGSTFLRQAANLRYLDGWLSAAGIAVAVLMPTLLRWAEGDRFTWNAGRVERRGSRVEETVKGREPKDTSRIPPTAMPARSGRMLGEVTLVLAVLAVGDWRSFGFGRCAGRTCVGRVRPADARLSPPRSLYKRPQKQPADLVTSDLVYRPVGRHAAVHTLPPFGAAVARRHLDCRRDRNRLLGRAHGGGLCTNRPTHLVPVTRCRHIDAGNAGGRRVAGRRKVRPRRFRLARPQSVGTGCPEGLQRRA